MQVQETSSSDTDKVSPRIDLPARLKPFLSPSSKHAKRGKKEVREYRARVSRGANLCGATKRTLSLNE